MTGGSKSFWSKIKIGIDEFNGCTNAYIPFGNKIIIPLFWIICWGLAFIHKNLNGPYQFQWLVYTNMYGFLETSFGYCSNYSTLNPTVSCLLSWWDFNPQQITDWACWILSSANPITKLSLDFRCFSSQYYSGKYQVILTNLGWQSFIIYKVFQ